MNWSSNMKGKIQSKKGFSLVEMLTAVLLLSLMVGFVGGGVVVVRDAYENITLRAEARTLLSTAITSISTELSQAKDISQESSTCYFYHTGRKYRMSLQNKNGNIYIVSDVGENSIPLLTKQTLTRGLTPTIKQLTFDTTSGLFHCSIEIYYNDSVYETQEIYIRPMNES